MKSAFVMINKQPRVVCLKHRKVVISGPYEEVPQLSVEARIEEGNLVVEIGVFEEMEIKKG